MKVLVFDFFLLVCCFILINEFIRIRQCLVYWLIRVFVVCERYYQ